MANITSYNAPLITSQDFGIDIARGQVAGAKPFESFGETTLGTGFSNVVIWSISANFIIPPLTGATLDIESTSVNDTNGGSGVNVVEVHYLDLELKEQSKLITLNGTTRVPNVITDARFINEMHVHVTGTLGQGAVGHITLLGSDTYNIILAGNLRSYSSARMVPYGKRGIIAGFTASSISGTAAARSLIQIVATELDNHQYTDQNLWIPFGSVGVQDNSETFIFPVPFSFKEGTAIAMYLKDTDKGATVTGSWFGWLEDQ